MSQLDDAVSRYNKLLESGPYRDLGWAEALHQRMENDKLTAGGRLICPFLRPNFISRRQYENLVKTGESLIAATYSSRYTARNFWRDDAGGISYQVQVQVPQPKMTEATDVERLN